MTCFLNNGDSTEAVEMCLQSVYIDASNNNKKFRSYKSKENIHKKELGHTMVLAIKASFSDPINLAKGARGKYCELANFNNGSRLKD